MTNTNSLQTTHLATIGDQDIQVPTVMMDVNVSHGLGYGAPTLAYSRYMAELNQVDVGPLTANAIWVNDLFLKRNPHAFIKAMACNIVFKNQDGVIYVAVHTHGDYLVEGVSLPVRHINLLPRSDVSGDWLEPLLADNALNQLLSHLHVLKGATLKQSNPNDKLDLVPTVSDNNILISRFYEYSSTLGEFKEHSGYKWISLAELSEVKVNQADHDLINKFKAYLISDRYLANNTLSLKDYIYSQPMTGEVAEFQRRTVLNLLLQKPNLTIEDWETSAMCNGKDFTEEEVLDTLVEFFNDPESPEELNCNPIVLVNHSLNHLKDVISTGTYKTGTWVHGESSGVYYKEEDGSILLVDLTFGKCTRFTKEDPKGVSVPYYHRVVKELVAMIE